MSSLESLPLELRQHIYGLALDRPGEIKLVSDMGNPGVAPAGHSRERLHRSEVWDSTTSSWVPAVSNVALVYVSRAIKQDAVPVLYGNNEFSFEHTGALGRFLNQIGDSKQYLRRIAIEIGAHKNFNFRAPATQDTFEMLMAANCLRSLSLKQAGGWSRNDDRYPRLEVHELVDRLCPLLAALRASHETRKTKGNVLDVVNFPVRACANDWKHCGTREQDSNSLNLQVCTCRDFFFWCEGEADEEEQRELDEQAELFKKALAARLGMTME